MGTVLTYIKSNAAGFVCLLAAAALFVGCSFLDPEVAIPAELREKDQPAALPLSRAIPFLADAEASLTRRSVAYAAEIEADAKAIGLMRADVDGAAEWKANVNALIWNGGKEALTAGAAAFPGLNLILPGLIGLGGLLMEKPGAKKKIAKVEAKGYTIGFNEAIELHKTGKLPESVPVEVIKESIDDRAAPNPSVPPNHPANQA